MNADGTPGACVGCDETLLAQRKAFLRPDSLVAIVMLSDENDCSIRDDGVGWFVGSSNRMPLSTDVCETNPNDPCCRSCAQKEPNGPPSGCAALSADATCKTIPTSQQYATWDMTARFAQSALLQPAPALWFRPAVRHQPLRQRAQEHDHCVCSRPVKSCTNPLYDAAARTKPRAIPSLVFLAGIVGVPWQDIADDASLTDPKALTYLTAKELPRKRSLVGAAR